MVERVEFKFASCDDSYIGGVYGLVDPRDGGIRYIGRTRDFGSRYGHHLYCARGLRFHTSRWIRDLDIDGYAPLMVAIDPEPSNEIKWIAAMLDAGCHLLNSDFERGRAAKINRQSASPTDVEIRHEAICFVNALARCGSGGAYSGDDWLLLPMAWARKLERERKESHRRFEERVAEAIAKANARRDYILGDGLVNEIRGVAAR